MCFDLIKGDPKTAHSLHIDQLIQHPLFPALSRYYNIKYTTFFLHLQNAEQLINHRAADILYSVSGKRIRQMSGF